MENMKWYKSYREKRVSLLPVKIHVESFSDFILCFHIVVCGPPFSCRSVTSRKHVHVLGCHFDQSKGQQIGHMRFPTVNKLIITLLL